MHKKAVPAVEVKGLSVMAKHPCLNRDFFASNVTTRLPGKLELTELPAVSIGLNCGLSKAIRLGGFANFLVIVPLLLTTLRIIGLNRDLRNKFSILKYSTCFMMRPIFTRMAAC